MGFTDESKISELADIYLLQVGIDEKDNAGFYWEDGLILLWSKNDRTIDFSRKNY